MVRIHFFRHEKFAFKAEVLSSGARKWIELFVSCSKGFSCENLSTPGVAYDGKLYFLGVNRILVHDPYNKSKVATSIGIPIDLIELKEMEDALEFPAANCEYLNSEVHPSPRQ